MSTGATYAVNVARRYGLAALLSVAAAVGEVLLSGHVAAPTLFIALPAVVVAAWYGGIGPGVLVTVVAVAIAAWRMGPPELINSSRPTDVVSVGLFVLTALLLSLTMRQLRRVARDERRRRVDTDRLLRRTTVLEALARGLAAARTSADVTRVCASELIEATGATSAAVALVTEGVDVEFVQAVGYDESIVGRRSLTSTSVIAASLRKHEVVTVSRDDVRDVAIEEVEPFLARHEALVVVPLVASRALGVVTLGFDHPRVIDDDERASLAEAGVCAAQALERARLYDSAERSRAEGEAFRVRADAELQERRRAEQAHRESEARYRTLAARTQRLYSLSAALSEAITLEAVANAIVRHGRSVVGAAAGAVALYSAEEVFETLYAEEYPPAVVEAWPRFPAEPGLCTTAAVATRLPVLVGSFAEWQAQYSRSAATAADGGFTSAASLPLLVDNKAIGVLSFHFTVPVNFDQDYQALLTSVAQHAAQAIDRARLYETSQRARVEAEAANHAKDDFLSIVSHELRTPLNAILGWGAMVRDGSLDAARIARAAEAIVSNANRQARLVDDLLEVSRIVAGRVSLDLQELDLAGVVNGSVEAMLPVAARQGVQLRIGELPHARVVADPHRLEQVFGNILANAVKFTTSGGQITVDGDADGDVVRVRITDTGCGIDPDVLPYIFERFRQGNDTTARTVGGLGLGLFIVRRLVEALQGHVAAESAGKGAGATFIVTLPLVTASGLDRTPSRMHTSGETLPTVQADLSDVRVLVVDDEADAREMMASALGLCGARVTTAPSVREALARLEHSEYDVLLSDLAMPDEDGYELIRRVRAHPLASVTRLPAAAVSACAREDEKQRALAAGFQLHVAKPTAPAALTATVTRLVGLAPTDA